MRVLETFSQGPKLHNEDRIIITPDFIGLTDGSSSSHNVRGEPGGLVAVRTIADAMPQIPADATFRECVDLLTPTMNQALTVEGQLIPADGTLTLYSRVRHELWWLGNGHAVVNGTPYSNTVPHMRLITAWRCAILRGRIRNGASVESLRALTLHEQPFREWLDVEPTMLNHPDDPYGAGCINGMPVPDRYLRVDHLPTARHIVIASDGFLEPPTSVKAGLRKLDTTQDADPLMIYSVEGDRPFKRGQRLFDDTSYVEFETD